MTAKEYLDRARTLDCEINSKKRELAKIKLDVQCLNSPSLSDKVISSHTNNSNSAVDKAVDLEKTIKGEMAQLIELQAEIHAKVEMIPRAEYRTLLTDYYITCDKWETVAENNGYSSRQMRRKHKSALEMFAAIHKF